MDVSVLKFFAAVMERGSFAAVARDLNIATSSVSRAVSSLEQELGVRLFQRSAKGLVPTEAGLLYHEHISPALESLHHAQTMVADHNEQPRGTLRVTAPMTFGQIIIVPLLRSFIRQYADLKIDLELTDRVIDLVEEKIDIAIRLGPAPDHPYTAREICPIKLLVCATPAYLEHQGRPAQPQDISRHNCLLFPFPGFNSCWRFATEKQDTIQVAVQGNCVISNALALKECVMDDMGLALLPEWVVAGDLITGKLINLFPDYQVTATDEPVSAWLMYPASSYVPLKILLFANHILNNAGQRNHTLTVTG